MFSFNNYLKYECIRSFLIITKDSKMLNILIVNFKYIMGHKIGSSNCLIKTQFSANNNLLVYWMRFAP